MRFYYCDANPLLRFAEAQVASAPSSCQRIAAEVRRLIETTGNIVAISEITLAEFQTNLFNFERDNGKPDFDSFQADTCLDQLMRWIESGRIEVIEQPPKLIEKAMAYVRMASRERACGLRAWDAAHLVQACYWAQSINVTVHVVTSDGIFCRFLKAFPEFVTYVRTYDPNTQKTCP